MPRHYDVQSGADDQSDLVDYEEGSEDLIEIGEQNRNENDVLRSARERGWQNAPSASQQLNHIKQSASNAREAASAASQPSAADSADASNDLRLITLVKRYERKLKEVNKRESELAEREKSSSSKSSKRRKSSSSRRHSSDTSESSDGDSTSDEVDLSDSSDSDSGRGHGRSSSSSNGDGKDITLRQSAVLNKFEKLKYVDINVFTRDNLTVRKAKKLVPIKSSAEYSAAWASLNVELQQYLINAGRGADALMVSKYYSQIVRLLTDYSSQWKLVTELDEYIRGTSFAVNEPVVWSIDREDDYVSRFKYDIRFKHQDASRVSTNAPSSQRGAYSNTRRSGSIASSSNTSNKSRNVCYAYNGLNSSTGEWTNSSVCLGADRCKFAHRCMHCHSEGHAIYERPECNAHPRVRAAPRPQPRR
jgi:hypothetical protein